MPDSLHHLYRFVRLVFRRFLSDGSSQTAASLTYTSLLAIVPLITMGLGIVSAFPAFAGLSASFRAFVLQNMMPDTASHVIRTYLLPFSQNAGKLTAIGTITLSVTALLMMQTIEHALNGIWHVRHKRPWIQRFIIYWAILTLGPLLIGGSLYAASSLASQALGYSHQINRLSIFGLRFVPILFTVTALSLLYQSVPNRYVRSSHAWIGGLIGGVCFEAMKLLYSDYISHFPSYTMVYGAFAALPLFLLWVYLSWITVLIGATIAAALTLYRHAQQSEDHRPGQRFSLALQVLAQLATAQQNGATLTLNQLAGATHAGWDELEELLDILTHRRLVLRSGRNWALATTPDHIAVRPLFDLLAWHASGPEPTLEQIVGQPQTTLANWLAAHQPDMAA